MMSLETLSNCQNIFIKMIENNWLGSKTDSGFYKRIKDENGKSTILSLNLKTLEYSPVKKVTFETISKGKKNK